MKSLEEKKNLLLRILYLQAGKINNHNMENLVAFGLTLEYFGMENIEISY